MDWIMYFIAFILGGIVMFMTICIVYAAKREEPVNRVHFYVEISGRDKEPKLYIQTIHGYKLMIAGPEEFKWFGLNTQDFDFIEEYKPVEVFINTED
ncbi:MAG: hypothetical protein SOZ29_06335 [Prevotella sp.]|nr:hypothetical protein [Prevotella sp.]MDY3897685.1 hypothetical protein [Prevotella sp.]